MQNQEQTPQLTHYTPEALEQKLQEGYFFDTGRQGMRMQNLKVCRETQYVNAPIILCDLRHIPRSIKYLTVLGCAFPEGLQIYEDSEPSDDDLQLTWITIAECTKSSLKITLPTTQGISVISSNLEKVTLCDQRFGGLSLQHVSIKELDVTVDELENEYSLAFESAQIGVLRINTNEQVREQVRNYRFKLSVNPSTLAFLEIAHHIQTNIPQLVRFFRLLCPTTQIVYTGDMRDIR